MMTQTNAAVSSAVRNTPVPDNNLNGKTMGQVINDIDRNDLKKSYKAIDAAYDIVIRKDGLSDTQSKLDGLKADIGERVYDVLKIALDHCEGKLPIAKAYFAALCKKAEEYFLSRYVKENREETTIAKAIPLWPQYKSSFLKGLDFKMSPAESIPDTDAPRWPTASKYRGEVQKREKDAKGGNSQAGNERNSSNQTTTVVNLVTKGWSPVLAASMNVLCTALNRLSHEQQDQFAQKLLDLGAEVTTFADANPVVIQAQGGTTPPPPSSSGDSEGSEESADDVGTQAALQAAMDRDSAPKAGSKRRGARAA